MKRFIGILCTLYFVTSSLYAQTSFEQANAAYAEGRYEEAATLYQAMIDEQPNAILYYNLGNAQFKQGELAQAILAYERALRLQPHHKDAKYNLAFAQSKITSKSRISSSPPGRVPYVTDSANEHGSSSLSACLSWR